MGEAEEVVGLRVGLKVPEPNEPNLVAHPSSADVKEVLVPPPPNGCLYTTSVWKPNKADLVFRLFKMWSYWLCLSWSDKPTTLACTTRKATLALL